MLACRPRREHSNALKNVLGSQWEPKNLKGGPHSLTYSPSHSLSRERDLCSYRPLRTKSWALATSLKTITLMDILQIWCTFIDDCSISRIFGDANSAKSSLCFFVPVLVPITVVRRDLWCFAHICGGVYEVYLCTMQVYWYSRKGPKGTPNESKKGEHL